MRRIGVLVLASVALFVGACGGGGSDDKDATKTTDASKVASGLSKLAASSQFASVCSGGKAAMQVGAAFASAAGAAGEADYNEVASGLQKAADAAPAEIKDDFQTIADALGPYLKLIGESGADYMKLAQNADFQKDTQALGSDAYKTASTNITTWFADHCK